MPLVRNVRDIRRYCASLPVTVRTLEGKIKLVDVFALEAIRVFLPDTYRRLIEARDALTSLTSGLDLFKQHDDQNKQQILDILNASGPQAPVVRALIERLFPAAAHHLSSGSGAQGTSSEQYLSSRRVAHPDWFGFYLEHVASTELQSLWRAEESLPLLTDSVALDAFIRKLPPREQEGLIGALGDHADEFSVEGGVSAIPILIDVALEIPDRTRSMLEVEPLVVVRRVMDRVLTKIPDLPTRDETVRSMIARLSTLSDRYMLLWLVSNRDEYGLDLISPEAAQELEIALREEIRATDEEALASESQIYWLIEWVRSSSLPEETSLDLSQSLGLRRALLKSSVYVRRSQGFGSRAVNVEKRLRWEGLGKIFGDEEGVRLLVEDCRDLQGDDALREAVELADRYLAGELPGRF